MRDLGGHDTYLINGTLDLGTGSDQTLDPNYYGPGPVGPGQRHRDRRTVDVPLFTNLSSTANSETSTLLGVTLQARCSGLLFLTRSRCRAVV